MAERCMGKGNSFTFVPNMCKLEKEIKRRAKSAAAGDGNGMYCNLFDSHTHSSNSFDGTHTVMFMCESAVQNGLLGICITDHFDTDFFGEQHNFQRLAGSYFDVRKARVAFGQSFGLMCGLEIGEPDADLALAEQALAQAQYDFVLGSIHTVEDKKDPYRCNFAQEDPYALLAAYFARMRGLAEWNRHDVLAHLTYPVRYILRDGRNDVTLDRYDDEIDEILRLTAQNGKGLEINTSGLRQGGCGLVMPSLRQLRRFHELGGELITIGSDAHRAEDVGANIADGMELAEAAGFRYFAYYKDREPRMLRIL